MKTFANLLIIVFLAISLQQCMQVQEKHHHHTETTISKALCTLNPTKGDSVIGQVSFEKVDEGIKVSVHITGLTPGKHGFHVHQYGDCSSGDGKSAGGHFNPGGHDHGSQTVDTRHVGDLGNVVADENGVAKSEFIDDVLSFSGENSIIGRAIIVHAGEDDLKSQPTGNAGARVACGVIGVVAD